MQDIFAFLALLLPLTLSPGPATIALIGVSMNKGIFQSLPFYFGLLISSTIIVVAGGMGLNEIFLTNQVVYKIIHYGGILFILYLGFKLIHAKPTAIKTRRNEYCIYDGMILTALNPKFYMIVAVIFSQLLKPGQSTDWTIILGINAVMALSLFFWLVLGASLKSLLKSENVLRIQNIIFGLLLLSVAVSMLL